MSTNLANDADATARPVSGKRAIGPWSDLALHTIGWRAFQDLCSQICEVKLQRPVEIFREAQPALLFLVPFTLLPLLIMAYIKVIFLIQIKLCFVYFQFSIIFNFLKGDLYLMWNEPFTYTAPKYFYVCSHKRQFILMFAKLISRDS